MSRFKDEENSDQLFWHKFRAGDRYSYTVLIKKYTNPLFRYGIRFADDEAFVKDCIQDVFLALWNSRLRINQTPSVKAYLFKALRLRIFRERSKWGHLELSDDNYQFIADFGIEEKLIEEQNMNETNMKILKVLNQLPKRQKEIVYLRFYEGMDHDRIAEVMRLSKQSVYNLLHEAVNNLRKTWFSEIVLLVSLLLSIS